jgi:hypothetical protein
VKCNAPCRFSDRSFVVPSGRRASASARRRSARVEDFRLSDLVFVGTVESIQPIFLSRWYGTNQSALQSLSTAFIRAQGHPPADSLREVKDLYLATFPQLDERQKKLVETAESLRQMTAPETPPRITTAMTNMRRSFWTFGLRLAIVDMTSNAVACGQSCFPTQAAIWRISISTRTSRRRPRGSKDLPPAIVRASWLWMPCTSRLQYLFDGLPTGTYQLSVFAAGFPKTNQLVAGPRRLNIKERGCSTSICISKACWLMRPGTSPVSPASRFVGRLQKCASVCLTRSSAQTPTEIA